MTDTVKCPDNIILNRQIRQWYMEHARFVPGNYKLRPEVRVISETLSDLVYTSPRQQPISRVEYLRGKLSQALWEDEDWVLNTWDDRWNGLTEDAIARLVHHLDQRINHVAMLKEVVTSKELRHAAIELFMLLQPVYMKYRKDYEMEITKE